MEVVMFSFVVLLKWLILGRVKPGCGLWGGNLWAGLLQSVCPEMDPKNAQFSSGKLERSMGNLENM